MEQQFTEFFRVHTFSVKVWDARGCSGDVGLGAEYRPRDLRGNAQEKQDVVNGIPCRAVYPMKLNRWDVLGRRIDVIFLE